VFLWRIDYSSQVLNSSKGGISMKKTLVSLLTLSTLTFGGLSVSAEEGSNVMKENNLQENLNYQDLNLGRAINYEEYTNNENENDGLNTKPGFIPNNSTEIIVNPFKIEPGTFTTFGAGEWDYLTYDYINNGSSKIVSSGGGDFMFVIDQPYIGPGFTWLYKVYEDDGAIGDDVVGTWEMGNYDDPQAFIINARNYVDGDNDKAEFYIKKMTVPTQTVLVEFYD
jgi:hypothetical protein